MKGRIWLALLAASLRGKPHQPDGQHLTPEGCHMLAEQLVGQVAGALGR